MEIEPQERQRLIDEAIKGRDNVIRYNLHSTTDWKLLHEVDGLKYFTHQTNSPHEMHGQISGMIFKPPLFVLHHFAVWRYRSKYERNYQQITKVPLEETTQHQVHLVHGVWRPVLFLIKRDHVAVEYIGKIKYEGSEYHVASYKNVQTSLIPLYKDYDRVETSIGITIEPRNEGRYSFIKYTFLTKLDRISPNFCGKIQGMLKQDVVAMTMNTVPTFKQAWEIDDDDDDDDNDNNESGGPPILVLSELKERLSSRDCEDLPRNLEKYNRYNDWSWEQVGSFDDVQLSVINDPKVIKAIGEFDLAWKMTFTSTLLHPIAQLLSYELTFSRLLWDPCTTSVQILFEDNPFQVILVKGGGWHSETGCIPFQYVCRTYAVAGENYDLLYEEHDNGDVFLFKFAATPDDFTITSVDVIFLAKKTNWEFKLNAKQYTDIISLTLTDLFVNAVVEFRSLLVSSVTFSASIKNQNRARRPRTPRPALRRKPQKESSLEKLKKHSRTADQLKVHGNFASTIRRRTFRILPPPIVFQPSPRHSIDLEFSKIDLTRQFSICILPDEILMEIFALLSLADLCKCAQVCALWKKISEDHVLWAFEPESLFTSTSKGDEWILYFTSSKNIYSTHDADVALAGDPPPSSSSFSSSSSSSSSTFSISGIVNPSPVPLQSHGIVNNPYSAAYNHVYNTFANQNNNYPHTPSHPILSGNSLNTFNRFTSNYSTMGGSLGTFGKSSFNHYSQYHKNNVNTVFNNNSNNNNNTNNINNINNNNLLNLSNNNNISTNNNNINNNNIMSSFEDTNNNNSTNSDDNSILNNNNILYAISKLQEFADKNEDEAMEELDSISIPAIAVEEKEKEKEKRRDRLGKVEEIDVDTLNPEIYSISINDVPAETIHVERARKRFASVWTKELGGGMVEKQNAKNSAHNSAHSSLHSSGHTSLQTSGQSSLHSSTHNTTYNTTVNTTHNSENNSEHNSNTNSSTNSNTNSSTNSNSNSNANSNANSEANSALTSANTSFTNFFELSVPSVHEYVRKTVRNFRPHRKTYEEMPKNVKRQSQAHARTLEKWASGKFKRQCEKQGPSPVLCVRVDENDNNAYCGYANGLLNVFQPDGKLSRFRMMNHPITDVMPCPDGLRVALANGTVHRLNASDLSPSLSPPISLIDNLDPHQHIPAVFGRSHNVVATWEDDSTIVDLFNTNTGRRQQFTHDVDGAVSCVEVGNNRLAVGLDDGAVALWDLSDTSSALLTFRSHGTGVTCVNMSPGPLERVVTSGSKDGCVMVWDERAGPYYVKRFRSKNEIYSIETKEYKLIVGMNNGNVAYWDPRYLFRPLHSWHLHDKGAPIIRLKCYAQESHMLCGSADGFVGIYDFS